MNLKSKLNSELDKLVHAITKTEGIIAVILFGSRARGDYDEHSDYDLLVVFEDDGIMWQNRRELYKNIGSQGLFTQVLTRSLKELTEKTEPTFLQNILQQGTILYLRHPFSAPAFAQNLIPMAIVGYSLAELPHNEKMKVNYSLFGKTDRKGLVDENGGTKLGDGCFMIPEKSLDKATTLLKEFGVHFSLRMVYASPLTKTIRSTWVSS